MKGLHWDQIPGDNDEEVAARGILYLLIFQQLGQLVRWSWGYHVLLAPPESYIDDTQDAAIEEGLYRDEPDLIPGLDGVDPEDGHGNRSSTSFESGGRTPITNEQYAGQYSDEDEVDPAKSPRSSHFMITPTNGNSFPNDPSNGHITSFPSIRQNQSETELPHGVKGWIPRAKFHVQETATSIGDKISDIGQNAFQELPPSVQHYSTKLYILLARFFHGLWEFMNPPLWAMLIAVVVASIPNLQRLFFEEGSFIANSVTRAVAQSGGVAVPLILVVLGANLARNTLPKEANNLDSEENRIGTKLLIASLISRMLLPTLIMAPLLALTAKYIPVSIVDDPIFVIVCFLLTGAPSALQLAQICQINGVYEGVMSKLLFQSYVIWYARFSALSHPTPYPKPTTNKIQDPPLNTHPRNVRPRSRRVGRSTGPFCLKANPKQNRSHFLAYHIWSALVTYTNGEPVHARSYLVLILI